MLKASGMQFYYVQQAVFRVLIPMSGQEILEVAHSAWRIYYSKEQKRINFGIVCFLLLNILARPPIHLSPLNTFLHTTEAYQLFGIPTMTCIFTHPLQNSYKVKELATIGIYISDLTLKINIV